ncbi:hypothetical protein [Nitrospira sp. Nam74]
MSTLNIRRPRVIELGCYDAKTLSFLNDEPEEYLGLDANWEGGLDIGRLKWKDRPNISLQYCLEPPDIPIPPRPYTVGICMETVQHIPPHLLRPYLERLNEVVEGYLFFTIPVERGVIFFLRRGLKKIMRMEDYNFKNTPIREFLYCAMGRLNQVKRRDNKGFDDRTVVDELAGLCDIVKVSGILPGLPWPSLNFQVGIIAKTKH